MAERNALAWEVLRLRDAGRLDDAARAADRLMAVERAIFGESHEDYAGALEFVSGVDSARGHFERARDELRRVLAIREKALGKGHSLTTDTRFTLARAERLTGLSPDQRRLYALAVRLQAEAGKLGARSYEVPEMIAGRERAAAAMKEAVGPDHPEYALALEQLGWAYRTAAGGRADGPYGEKAAQALRTVLAVRERAFAPNHPDVARALESLADFPGPDDGPDFAAAKLRQALAVREASQGADHPDVARVLMRLANLDSTPDGDQAGALALCQRALKITEEARGELDPTCLSILQTLGKLYHALDDATNEERVIRRRIAIQEKKVRDEPSPFAASWIGRLGTPPDPGTFRFAHRWSAYVTREILASTIGELARFHGARGEIGQAGLSLRASMNVYAENFDRMAAISVGRHAFDPMGLGMYQINLERFLTASLDPLAEITPDQAYRQVLAWKGGYFAYEQRARRWRTRPELAALARELRESSDRLAAAALSAPAPDDRAGWDRILQWQSRVDKLEGEIADRAAKQSATEARERPEVERLAAALPAGSALVDFKVYMAWNGWDEATPNARRLMAFVVRSTGPVVRLDLGPWSPIFEAVNEWRQVALPRAPGTGPETTSAEWRATREATLAMSLRTLVWEPLEPYIQGVSTVLVAPDAALCRFPLAALQGRAPDTRLIDELAVAVVPVPQLLAAVAEKRRATVPSADTPVLLAVGDVDFDAATGPALAAADRPGRGPSPSVFTPRARMMRFLPLAGTARELESVKTRFTAGFPGGTIVALRGKEATEGAFRLDATRARFIHLATHGFFEPPELATKVSRPGDELSYWSTPGGLVRLSPGLLSGVAFAGANRAPAADRDDGIVTAVEAQQLDLGGVDLVVLSACETALGSESHGEGLMGLQRAFQVAGARALISSLWSVDDEATALLMGEFYANLWDRRIPRLEALRQAQLAVLHRYDPHTHALLPTPSATRRVPPYFWAAFTLSGDWR